MIVKDSKGNRLKKDTDYTVKYSSGRKKIGKYTVTVTFKGKYSGSKKLVFKIKPKAPFIQKLASPSRGSVSIALTGVTSGCGYKVYYSSSKNGTYKVLDTSKTKLKSGKKYYFKVRVYKKTSGGTIYSSYSTAKSVKIK